MCCDSVVSVVSQSRTIDNVEMSKERSSLDFQSNVFPALDCLVVHRSHASISADAKYCNIVTSPCCRLSRWGFRSNLSIVLGFRQIQSAWQLELVYWKFLNLLCLLEVGICCSLRVNHFFGATKAGWFWYSVCWCPFGAKTIGWQSTGSIDSVAFDGCWWYYLTLVRAVYLLDGL